MARPASDITPFISRTVAHLRDRLRGLQSEMLPTVRVLSRDMGVSVPTILKSLAVLRSEGSIDVDQGRRCRRRGTEKPCPRPLAPRETSRERLFQSIHAQISCGEYQSGKPLPKREHFCIEWSVSPATVTAVLRRLQHAGVIHKKGKRYWVGAVRPIETVRTPALPDVILVVTRTPHSWEELCRNTRLGSFGQTFLEQTRRCGIRTLRVITGPDNWEESWGALTGTEAVSTFLRDAGARYLGALIADTPNRMADFEDWTRLLGKHGKPVVWFDYAGVGWPICRPNKTAFRCTYSEEAIAGAALDFLHSFGHRRVGFLYSREYPWHAVRMAALKQHASRLSPPLHLVCHEWSHLPTFWDEPNSPNLILALEEIRESGWRPIKDALRALASAHDEIRKSLPSAWTDSMRNPAFRALVAVTRALRTHNEPVDKNWIREVRVIWAALELHPLLKQQGCTAIIGPNDLQTKALVLQWIRQCNLSVPQQVSVISFDNMFRDAFFPLTSVDFGFDQLGYRAFQRIVGEVPILATRNGDIVASSTVVDNGSVSRHTEEAG